MNWLPMESKSRRSILPNWNGETYTKFAAPFYDFVTRLTRWQEHLNSSALTGLRPGKFLDIGCGTGYVINEAVSKGFTVVGIDPSSGMLEKARCLPNVKAEMLVLASASSLPFPDQYFDVTFASGSLVHVQEITSSVNEILRVTRPGGTIRIIDHLSPIQQSPITPLALLFSQLSGDIIHDYPSYFSSGAKLVNRQTLGRGGILQQLDFQRLSH